MLPRRGRRRYGIERLLVRLIATFGIIGIGVALGAILAASKVQGWIIGLVVAAVSVILAGLLVLVEAVTLAVNAKREGQQRTAAVLTVVALVVLAMLFLTE